MQFQVPQFIYRESKIIGPLTFKQFIYIGAATAICFLLYFLLGKRNFLAFLFLSLILILGSLFLAFGQVGGRSMPTAMANFFVFAFSRKLYLWKKKETPLKILIKKEASEERQMAKTPPSLKIAEKSRLRDLSTQIETKT